MAYINLKNLESVSAKILAQKLFDAGIENAPIRITADDGVVCVWFHAKNNGLIVCRNMPGEVPENGWKPSWVQDHLWVQMTQVLADKWRRPPTVYEWCAYLMENMEIDWLGLGFVTMEEIKASFIKQGLVGRPVRQRGSTLYYFDDNLVYQHKECFAEMHLVPAVRTWPVTCINLWRKAVTKFTPGMSFEQCMEIFLTTSLKKPWESDEPTYTELELLVQKVHAPQFERSSGNKRRGTIDFIRVEVSLPRYRFNREELRAEIKAHKAEIDQLVVERIQNDKRFPKCGVPLNFFHLTSCILSEDRQLEYLFELKSIERR